MRYMPSKRKSTCRNVGSSFYVVLVLRMVLNFYPLPTPCFPLHSIKYPKSRDTNDLQIGPVKFFVDITAPVLSTMYTNLGLEELFSERNADSKGDCNLQWWLQKLCQNFYADLYLNSFFEWLTKRNIAQATLHALKHSLIIQHSKVS